jgi:MerR family mercuric resistance operon transcriptional regulator
VSTANTRLTIGAIARAARVHVETVRYYERIGLLSRPPRAAGCIRRYPDDALQRVRFIKRAQWLGFSLEEVATLLALAEGRVCRETRALGETKLALVRRKLEDLAVVRSVLEALLSECARSPGRGCPLIDALLCDDEPAFQHNGQRGKALPHGNAGDGREGAYAHHYDGRVTP